MEIFPPLLERKRGEMKHLWVPAGAEVHVTAVLSLFLHDLGCISSPWTPFFAVYLSVS